MLNTLMSRLFQRQEPPAPRAAAPARATAVASSARPAPVVPAAAAPAASAVGVGAQRPLVSVQGALAGFEFSAGALMRQRMDAHENHPAAGAYTANLLGAMRLCTTQGMVALAEMPASWLTRVAGDQHFSPGMHLLLRADGAGSDKAAATALVAPLVARLRAARVRVGWNPLAQPPIPAEAGRPDFMPLVAPPGSDAPAWRAAMAAAAEHAPGVPLVLLDLPAVDVLEAVLAPPVLLAACTVGANTVPPRAQALPPQARRLLQLLNRLLHDDDNTALVADIKADAALSLRLLQYLNSAGATPGRELESIEQAVLVLGRAKLYHWVAQLLVRMAPPRPAADALQAVALARARMFESLARRNGEAQPGSLYLLGLASMLPMLLGCNIDDAAQAMNLPSAATQALRQQGGAWQPYLSLLAALEANDLAAAEALAAPFGGLQAVLDCWAEAWQPR